MSASNNLPETMSALVCPARGQFVELQDIPTPQPTSGSVIVKVLATTVDAELPNVLGGKTVFTFPEPFVPGALYQLVMVEPFLRARDTPNRQALFGVFDGLDPASKKWIADNWRNGNFAQFVSAPLENVYALNEQILCDNFNYTIPELTFPATQLIAYGGLRAINLQAGETVIVAPATGAYTGAAVGVAVAMGANVIAASRNLSQLQRIQSLFPKGRVQIAQLTNDVTTDTATLTALGPAHAYIDISPPAATKTTHVRSCFNALQQYGRVCLAGFINQDIAVDYSTAVLKNLTIRGSYMYEREHVTGLMQLIENGMLKLGKDAGFEVVGEFGLKDIQAAVESARNNGSYGKLTVLAPWSS